MILEICFHELGVMTTVKYGGLEAKGLIIVALVGDGVCGYSGW